MRKNHFSLVKLTYSKPGYSANVSVTPSAIERHDQTAAETWRGMLSAPRKRKMRSRVQKEAGQ